MTIRTPQIEPIAYDAATAQAIRRHLEMVAMAIESIATNAVYLKAFKTAARIVRESKPD